MLSDIEALVGRQICTRNAHGFVFNEFGDVLAARASRVVAEVENIGRDIREVADGLRGRWTGIMVPRVARDESRVDRTGPDCPDRAGRLR